ncbi:unnamed protein product [Trypanosoma congolense IL3000]|uniref:WGS project CAEQ00000000 data, annotated contig 2121 n=1 Tax=Trypanosoma congolense (strain IL3000) TaxID=1068625 RepID=F9WBM3_TRYCI|nr:unnamed protein product [Trypanosoma congolense IL3000]
MVEKKKMMERGAINEWTLEADVAYFLINLFERTTDTNIFYLLTEYKKGIMSAFRFFTPGTTSNKQEQLKEGNKRPREILEDIPRKLKEFHYNLAKDNLFIRDRGIRVLRDFTSNRGALAVIVSSKLILSRTVISASNFPPPPTVESISVQTSYEVMGNLKGKETGSTSRRPSL